MSEMRRKPGEVRDAILTYLRKQRVESSVTEIHKAVESALGTKVPASSVRSYLRLNAGEVFDRTKRGRYRLLEK